MLETPQIVRTSEVLTAVIPLKVPASEIRNVMHPGLTELRAAVAAQGVAVVGPWFTHHFRAPTDTFDFEIGLPVASPVKPAGRMKPGMWPAMTVARTVYRGPYEGLGAAWGEFCNWLKTGGHTPAADLWECYLAGPESSPDPANWRTELNRPLVAKSR